MKKSPCHTLVGEDTRPAKGCQTVEREYKSGQIEVSSYPSGGRWRPIVIVSKQIRDYVLTRNLSTPSDWLFHTEQKSDEEGYQLGAAWIDRQEEMRGEGGVEEAFR